MGRLGVAAVIFGLVGGCGSSEPDDPPPTIVMAPISGHDMLHGAVRITATMTRVQADSIGFYVDTVAPANLIGDAAANSDGEYIVTWYTAETGNGDHDLIATTTVDGETIDYTRPVTVMNRTRADSIPGDAVKMTPATDAHPPNLEPAFAAMFDPCVPLPGPVNTAGAEDAPYITADGQELYLFFTPDAGKSAIEQLGDRVTGIYRSRRDGSVWGEPERVFLSYHDDPGLDGCETIFGDELWFCTARVGVERAIDIYVAHRDGDHWVDWQSVGSRLNLDLLLGELHIADGGDSIYYHSELAGGQGGIDLWLTRRESGGWSDPINLTAVNSEFTDGWPWVSADGQELWFTGGPAAPEIWRSVKSSGNWQAPQKVVSPFAGESTFDADGNLYFTHHFWDDDSSSIIEADIYICMRK